MFAPGEDKYVDAKADRENIPPLPMSVLWYFLSTLMDLVTVLSKTLVELQLTNSLQVFVSRSHPAETEETPFT